jgi:hypothetical protein
MCQVNPKYEKFVVIENGKKVLYLQLLKALYGCVQSALMWYDLFTNTLVQMGFKLVLDVIDSLLGDKTKDPEKLPWDAVRSTLWKGVFGGRVTDPADQQVLDELVYSFFIPASFNVDFAVVVPQDNVTVPESTTRQYCLEWIAKFFEHTPPTWIGLDSSAEFEREQRFAKGEKVVLIQEKCDEG